MMPQFAIVEARAHHCGQMARRLRMEHMAAVMRTGMNVHRELRVCFDASYLRRAWLINGELAALGGITGSILSQVGYVWLALTNEATRYPVALVKEARRQLDAIMTVKRELATTVIDGDDAAKRLAIFLGFHVGHDGLGQAAFSRFSRRSLKRFLETEPDLRCPIGGTYVVALGYHLDEEAA